MEAHDWKRTQHEACPHCHFDGSVAGADMLGTEFRQEGRRWERWLRDHDGHPKLRLRPSLTTWSAIEYACHVRDAIGVFAIRHKLMLSEDEPDLGWWDHAAAVTDDAYNTQPVDQVAAKLVKHANGYADLLDAVDGADWYRPGRRGGDRFTVGGAARFALHESYHHRLDAARVIG